MPKTLSAIEVPRTERPTFDNWSFVHAGTGFATGLAGFPRPIAYGLIIAVEAIEFMLAPSTEFFQESRRNIMADLIIGAAAFEVGRGVAPPVGGSVGAFPQKRGV